VLVGTGHVRLWELVVMSVVFGIADSFFGPASNAVMPELLPSDLIVQGNALNSTSQQLASGFIGPGLGGAIVGAVGTAWAFGIDAASFVVSALSLALMRRTPRTQSATTSFLDDAREGIRYVRAERWLWITLVAASIANFFGYAPIGLLVPLLVREVLHASAFELGLVFAAGGIGGVIASLVAGRVGTPKHEIVVMWCAYGVAVIPVCAMALSPNVWFAGVCVVGEVGLIIYGDVLFFSMLQQLVPKSCSVASRRSSSSWRSASCRSGRSSRASSRRTSACARRSSWAGCSRARRRWCSSFPMYETPPCCGLPRPSRPRNARATSHRLDFVSTGKFEV
jgi:MFS family permease